MNLVHAVNEKMEWFSIKVAKWTGSTPAFLLSVILIAGWLFTGPFYAYSDTWQLIANTFTTLVEFVMVFVLQRAQNKHTDAIQLKLDNIVAKLDAKAPDTIESNNEPIEQGDDTCLPRSSATAGSQTSPTQET